MKLQKLTIHNIASIEDAVIDFEAQPLSSSDVFLITGKTGSGKSTILDAICLALFADTPRLDGTQMEGETKDGNEDVRAKDPRQLLRRNTGEGYVKLTFTGSNGVHYEAQWMVRRANGNPKGRLQGKAWSLNNLDTGFSFNRDNEIKPEIKSAIGLDFNQFCRTTMLAQGEFTKFLNSNNADKAAILEKITGMDIYAKVGKKIFDVTKDKKQTLDIAKQRLEDIRTLTEDEVKAKKEEKARLEAEYKSINEAVAADKAKLLWIETEAKLRNDIAAATEEHEKAKAAVDSDDFKAKDLLVRQWNATIEARNWMAKKKEAEDSKIKQQGTLSSLESDYASVLGGYAFAEQEKQQAEDEMEELKNRIEGEKDKKEVYEKAQTIVGYLNTIADGRRKIADSQTDIENEKKVLAEKLTPAFEKAQREAQKAQEEYEKEEGEIKAQEAALAELNLGGLRERQGKGKDLIQNINTAFERIESLANEVKRRKDATAALENTLAEIEKKQKELEQLKPQIHDAEIRMTTCKEALDKQKDTVDKFVKTLRQRLKVGDECPVCRQKIANELPHEEELAKLVAGLDEDFKKAEEAFNNLDNDKKRLEAEIKVATDNHNTAKAALDKDKSVETAERNVVETCKKCDIERYDDNTPAALEELRKNTEAALKELGDKIADGENKDSAIKEQRRVLDKFRNETLEPKAKEVREAENAIKECKGRIAAQEEVVKSRGADVSDAEKDAAAIIAGQWDIDWSKQPKEFAEQLNKQAKSYQENVKQRDDLANRLSGMTTNCRQVKEVIDGIVQLMPAWKGITASGTTIQPDLLNKAHGVKGKATTALTQLQQAEEAAQESSQKLGGFIESHKDISIEQLEVLNGYNAAQIGEIDNQLKADRDKELTKKTLMEEAKRKQVEHLNGKPELKEGETAETLDKHIKEQEPELEKKAAEKGAIIQELTDDEKNKGEKSKQIEEAEKMKAEWQKWKKLDDLIGDATGKNFRKIAQSYVLSSLIYSANSYMKTLTDRYTLKVEPGSFVISIEDAYQGYASRAASTISGGESFLVSLSLALALSDIGDQLAVDTLFIDEGFGTLSGEPLQNAINTLRSLQTRSGRHVGIISHVEELQEKIPVQIQVIQEGNNSSSEVKVVDMTA